MTDWLQSLLADWFVPLVGVFRKFQRKAFAPKLIFVLLALFRRPRNTLNLCLRRFDEGDRETEVRFVAAHGEIGQVAERPVVARPFGLFVNQGYPAASAVFVFVIIEGEVLAVLAFLVETVAVVGALALLDVLVGEVGVFLEVDPSVNECRVIAERRLALPPGLAVAVAEAAGRALLARLGRGAAGLRAPPRRQVRHLEVVVHRPFAA